MRRRLVYVLPLAAALTCGMPLRAQEVESPSTADALDKIERTLKQIVALLQVQVSNQRAELTLRRLDLARRDLIARERELHDAQRERDGYLRRQAELETRREMFDDEWSEENGVTEKQLRYMREQEKRGAEALKQDLWRNEQRILDLEQEIRRTREDLETWEALVTESLTEP